MRYFNTALSLNANILIEIEAAILEKKWKIDHFLSINAKDAQLKMAIQKDHEELLSKKDAIINSYYEDLKYALLRKLSNNTELTNSIHIGKYQLHCQLDFLMIEGTVNGVNNTIMSASGFTDMKEVTHSNVEEEMLLLTHNFLFSMLTPNKIQINEPDKQDCFDVIVAFYDHITRLYLHQAIEKLHKEGIFDVHLKNRPFHIYYGEPNAYYYSVYYIEK